MDTCLICGEPLEQSDLGRPRLYCSDRCRQRAFAQKSRNPAHDADVERVLAEARAIPGGSYPAGRGSDPRLDQLTAELQNSASPYRGGVATKAFISWLRTGTRSYHEAKALIEDSSGQTFIPSDIAIDIAAVARERGRIRDFASIRPTNRNKHQARLLTAATVGWGRLETGTGATDPANAPESPGQEIEVHDVLALAKVGIDELDDAGEAARAAIVEAIGSAIGDAEDLAFGAGSGSGQPKGLTLAANVARVAAGQKVTAGASATPTTADPISLVGKLPTRYRDGGVWLMSEDAFPKILALTFANGDAIMPNPGQGLGPFGYPFAVVPGLPAMSTAGSTDPSVWFVNLKAAYRIADRGQMTVQRLTQRFADQNMVGMIVKRRTGGDMIRPDAAAIYLL